METRVRCALSLLVRNWLKSSPSSGAITYGRSRFLIPIRFTTRQLGTNFRHFLTKWLQVRTGRRNRFAKTAVQAIGWCVNPECGPGVVRPERAAAKERYAIEAGNENE